MNRLITLILLLLFCASTNAQTYIHIPTITGNNIAPNAVSNQATGSGGYVQDCGTGPFWIGAGVAGSYKHTFSLPVHRVRAQMIFVHTGEIIRYFINGTKYSITAANLSTYVSTCNTAYSASALNGDLVAPSGIPFGSYLPGSGAQVDIHFPNGITEFEVSQINGIGNGSSYNLYFAYDTVIYAFPPADTMYCHGETMMIPFFVPNVLWYGNKFIVQLSDSAGSFTNPTVIDTVAGTGSDTVYYTIPDTLKSSRYYKVRVLSTYPAISSDPETFKVNISRYPQKPVATANPPCSGIPLHLGVSNYDSTVDYQWIAPSFTADTADTVIQSPTTAHNGKYIIEASLFQCKRRDTIDITVKPTPPTTTAYATTTLCEGDSLGLWATSTHSGVVYSWIGPNSFSSSQQNTGIKPILLAGNGVYTVKTTTTDNCYASDTIHVNVKPMPAAVSLTYNDPVCITDTLKLHAATTSSGVSFSWTGPVSFSDNTQSPKRANAVLPFSGKYYATLTLNGCVVNDSISVVINNTPPIPSLSYDAPVCIGDTLQLNAANINGAQFVWTGPNSFSSGQQNPKRYNITQTDAGVYSAYSVLNTCKSVSSTVTVSVNPLPFVVAYISPSDSVCAGSPAVFGALANNAGGTPTYNWFKNGIQVHTGISYSTTSITDNDIVHCEMTEYTKCRNPYTDPSNDLSVVIVPVLTPTVSILQDPPGPIKPYNLVSFKASTTNAGSQPFFQWKRNGLNVGGANDSVWGATILSDKDIISVDVTSTYRCPQPATVSSNKITVDVLVSVGDIIGVEHIKLYPNPNNGEFVLEGALPNGKYTLILTDITGRILYNETTVISQQNLHKEIAVESITKGVYVLSIVDEQGSRGTMRFVVE